jgi:hypothetical protein
MNKLNYSFYLLITILFANACSTDDSDTSNENAKLLKSRIYQNPDSSLPNRDEFYSYENEFLKSASGYSRLFGDYEYNSDYTKITRKTNSFFEEFTYEYYQDGRIKKENEIGTNNYIEFFYEPNKVITNRYYEFAGNNSRLEERELILDNQGRIIRMNDLATNQSAINTDYEIYEYDNVGNIIKVTTRNTGDPQERILTYTYTNIKNPYYSSYRNIYGIIYYLEFFNGLNIENNYGITPNLFESVNSTYDANSENYPTLEVNNQFNIAYEYYN